MNTGFFVKPIRQVNTFTSNPLVYDKLNGEVQYYESINGSVFFQGLVGEGSNGIKIADAGLNTTIKNNLKGVECWFKCGVQTQGGTPNLVSRYYGGPSQLHFNLFIISAAGSNVGRVTFWVANSGTTTLGVQTTNRYDDNQWHHAAVSIDTSYIRLYMDGGIETASTAITGTLGQVGPDSDSHLYFGNDNRRLADRYYVGNISDIRIWNRYRSQSEVQNDYLKRLVGTELGLISYWKLDENPATITNNTFKDSVTSTLSTSVNNVVISGTPLTKTFVIDHPIHSNKYLVHACLEGPESGVYYRGKGEIVNGTSVEVQLPAYVGALCPGADFTVQLTPIYDGTIRASMLYASEVDPATNSFRVYGENGRFNWLVHGKRFDIEVEPNKADVNKHGDGPYTYLSKKIGL